MPLIIIPARLQSARLPEKPLQIIGGDPLIVHCWRRAVEADVGPVWVATDAPQIIDVAERAGANTILTPEAQCGSDRVAIAVNLIDSRREEPLVINQQGDMPFLDPRHLRTFAAGMDNLQGMATAYCDLAVVRIDGDDFRRDGLRSHIGLYGFTRDALERFRNLGPSPRERTERLEQLRAVGKIDIRFIPLPAMPLEVNTPEDLDLANSIIALGSSTQEPAYSVLR